MIRRSTWVVFAVFLIVALAAIFLLKSPASPLPVNADATPSETPSPRVIEGWDASQVVSVELSNLDGTTQQLTRNADGSWTDTLKKSPVQAGQVEQLLSELLSIRVLTAMPSGYSLEALALTSPKHKIVIAKQDGTQLEFLVGNLTPTGNGYYVRTDNNPPVVVSNYAFDAVTQVFADIKATATPAVTSSPEATAGP